MFSNLSNELILSILSKVIEGPIPNYRFKKLMRLRRTCKLLNELIIIVINDEIFITYNFGWAIASLYYYKFIKNTACELTSYDHVNKQFCFAINDDQEFECGENLFVHLFWNDELVYYGSCYNVGESDDHNVDDYNEYNDNDELEQQREILVKDQEDQDQGNNSKQQKHPNYRFKKLMRLRRTCKLLNELIIIVINDEIFITYNFGWAIASLYYYKFIKNTACELTSYDHVNKQFCFAINDDQEFECGENLFVHLFWNDELVYYGSCYNVGESDDHNVDDYNEYNDNDELEQQREILVKDQEDQDQGNNSKQQKQWVVKEIKFHNSALGIKRSPKKGTYQITYVKISAIEIYKRLAILGEIAFKFSNNEEFVKDGIN
ncbi:hypothetical protein Glove_262g59 [Diversispora epigaea]|uniref:Uncharacterized protein n=1 Tax=Diversispora epigaea TaxID=1348612 RepID=A0A397IBC4_9GLOM|nr:hypothetical protein Glove_262g59 [Diversispora epigaea]